MPLAVLENRSRAQDVLAATLPSHEIEIEQRKQSELSRIRGEIMEIAREVAELRRLETEALAPRARPNPRGLARSQDAATRSAPPAPSKLPHDRVPEPVGRQAEHRQPDPRPPIPGKRRRQLAERAPQQPGSGGAEPATAAAPARNERPPLSINDEIKRYAPAKPKTTPRQNNKPIKRRGLSLLTKTALFAGVVLAGTGLITVALWGKLPGQGHERSRLALLFAHSNPPAAPDVKVAKSGQLLLASTGDQVTATTPFEMPENYGAYAISDGHLTALEPLPIRVPDARVSISSRITKPAPAPATSGNLLFAVYHRELATNVPESASVRIVAKVMQATTFVGGKPKTMPGEDAWAVRGGAIDLRIAPVATNKEMVLIRPADPNFTLPPGRYALMFRNQAYDFSVAGTVSDTAHCLERSDLQDGSVYSECRELPAAPAKL